MNNQWFDTATAAMAEGDLSRARALLHAYVNLHPGDDEGWYWFGLVVERPEIEIARLKPLLTACPRSRLLEESRPLPRWRLPARKLWHRVCLTVVAKFPQALMLVEV